MTDLSHSIGQTSYFEPSTQQTFPFTANIISGLDIACTLGKPIRMSHTVAVDKTNLYKTKFSVKINAFLYLSNSKMYEKEPRYNEISL